ncbi:MAG: mechanosensitive ion channel domain-containing protein, partial [Candidatus Levyibacteriota bacterium]
MFQLDFTTINDILILWFSSHGIKILGILIAYFVINKTSHVFIEKVIRKAVISTKFSSKESEKKREETLIRVFAAAFRIFLILIASMMILSEFGIDTGPLIAGAGIIGIALGFGGQYLIRDLISGFFIILENQYRVGDVVTLDKTSGLVEDINLRMTILRDMDGTVHHIPNGEIKIASNLSKIFARVNLDIGISYDADLEKVEKVVNSVGRNMAKDPKWKDQIIKAPKFSRVNEFADSSVVIKIIGETKPLKQWSVTGELRKRLKIAFDKEKIEIP